MNPLNVCELIKKKKNLAFVKYTACLLRVFQSSGSQDDFQ